MDLFGVVVLALVTALGGGKLRDMGLGATPLFWMTDSHYLIAVFNVNYNDYFGRFR